MATLDQDMMALEREARFPKGQSADPTENMNPEDAAKWKAMNEEHGGKFKNAGADGMAEIAELFALDVELTEASLPHVALDRDLATLEAEAKMASIDLSASRQVAETILNQMGGRMGMRGLFAMLGVKRWYPLTSPPGVAVLWPNKQRSKGNMFEVTLRGDDTYDMEFFNVSTRGKKSVKKFTGIYNDQLSDMFEQQTGWYLRMGSAQIERLEKLATFDEGSRIPDGWDPGHTEADPEATKDDEGSQIPDGSGNTEKRARPQVHIGPVGMFRHRWPWVYAHGVAEELLDYDAVSFDKPRMEGQVDAVLHDQFGETYPAVALTWESQGMPTGLVVLKTDRNSLADAQKNMRSQSRVAKEAASGLYGFTKKTQSDCESSVRKIQREARKIAQRAYSKNAKVAEFLSSHARRSESLPAQILVSALSEMGPKVASEMKQAAAAITPEDFDRLRPRDRIELVVGTVMAGPAPREFVVGRSSYSKKYNVYSKRLIPVIDGVPSKGGAKWVMYKRDWNHRDPHRPEHWVVSVGFGGMGTDIKKFRKLGSNQRLAELRALRAQGGSGYWSVVLPPGLSKWQHPRDTLTRGAFDSEREAHNWARKNIRGIDYSVKFYKMGAVSRARKENAVAGKFPPDSKKGRGKNRTVMLTGDVAKLLGKSSYTSVKLSELSDGDIDKLYNKLVGGKTAARPSSRDVAEAKRLFKKWRRDAESPADMNDLDDLWQSFMDGDVSLKSLKDNAKKAASAPRGKAQQAIAKAVKDWPKGHSENLSDMTSGAAFRGLHFAQIISAAEALAKKGLIEFDNVKVTKKAGLEDACWDGYEAVGMKEQGGQMVPNCVPKTATGKTGGIPGQGARNKQYLNSVDRHTRDVILRSIATHYGASVSEIVDEVTDASDAWSLADYIGNNRGLALRVHREMLRQGLTRQASTTERNQRLQEIVDAIPKTAAEDKEAARSYGLYGFSEKVASLGLSACSDVRAAAGRIAYNLHSRRANKHARITAFLDQHCKTAGCKYSRLLAASYPEASRTARVEPPRTVQAWLDFDID